MDVYKRVKNGMPPKGMAITDMEYQGKMVRGVMLDETHGCPVGCIAVKSQDTKFVQKVPLIIQQD